MIDINNDNNNKNDNNNNNNNNVSNNNINNNKDKEKQDNVKSIKSEIKCMDKIIKKPEIKEEEEKPSSLRVSFINNSEFSSLSYYDRERLSRMKLSLLYIKCCIAVLRPNSATFPKQNELHRWLDSKNHPPLTRIDIVCILFF